MIDYGQLLARSKLNFCGPRKYQKVFGGKTVSEEYKGALKINAIGRLKISATQASIVEDYRSIETRI